MLISSLLIQKTTVLANITDSRNSISSFEDKVSRLQEASDNLATYISELEILINSISNLTIEEEKRRGKNSNDFVNAYSTYEEKVQGYISEVIDEKDVIEQERLNYEEDKTFYTTKLYNLESRLDSLEGQITQFQRERY